MRLDSLVGKYKVVEVSGKTSKKSTIITDNAVEAVWEANKFPNDRIIINVCGEREIRKENGKYKLVK